MNGISPQGLSMINRMYSDKMIEAIKENVLIIKEGMLLEIEEDYPVNRDEDECMFAMLSDVIEESIIKGLQIAISTSGKEGSK